MATPGLLPDWLKRTESNPSSEAGSSPLSANPALRDRRVTTHETFNGFFSCMTHKSTASTLKRDHLVSNLQVCLYSRRYQGRGLCNKNLQGLLNLQQSLIGSGVQHGWQHLWTLHLHSPSRMKIFIRDRCLSGHCVKWPGSSVHLKKKSCVLYKRVIVMQMMNAFCTHVAVESQSMDVFNSEGSELTCCKKRGICFLICCCSWGFPENKGRLSSIWNSMEMRAARAVWVWGICVRDQDDMLTRSEAWAECILSASTSLCASPVQPGQGSGRGSSGDCWHTAQKAGSPLVLDWLLSPPAATACLRIQNEEKEGRYGCTYILAN